MRAIIRFLIVILFTASLVHGQALKWEAMGPFGGGASVIVQNPKNPEILYVASDQNPSRIFKSTNGGKWWEPYSTIPAAITKIIIDENRPEQFRAISENNIYKSSDAGKTWSLVSLPSAKNVDEAMSFITPKFVINPDNTDIIFYLGGLSGKETFKAVIFRSSDCGSSWEEKKIAEEFSLKVFQTITFNPHNKKEVYAVVRAFQNTSWQGIVYKSGDGGVSFKKDPSFNLIKEATTDLYIDPKIKKRCYLLSYRLHVSSDFGKTWEVIRDSPDNIRKIQIDHKNKIIYAMTYNELFRGDNYGKTWKRTDITGLYNLRNSFLVNRKNGTLYSLFNNGVNSSTDFGNTWSNSNNGLLIAAAPVVKCDPVKPEKVLVSMNNIGTFNTELDPNNPVDLKTIKWNRFPDFYRCTALAEIVIKPEDPKVIYAFEGGGWGDSELFTSTDGGSVWKSIDKKMTDGYALTLEPFIQAGTWQQDGYARTDPLKMAVFVSTDSGKNWERKSLTEGDGQVRSLCVNPENKKIIFAGGYLMQTVAPYQSAKKSRLYKSVDGGKSWDICGADIFGQRENETIYKLSYSPFDVNTVYAATDKGLYISKNGGNTWTAPTKEISFLSLICDPKNKNNIFGGGKNGFWISNDGGANWIQMNNGLLSDELQSLDYDPVNRIIYAGSTYTGLFRLRLQQNYKE